MEPAGLGPERAGGAARPLSLGGILDAALDLVRRHAALLIGLGALLYVPLAFVTEPLAEQAPGSFDPQDLPLAALLLAGLAVLATPVVIAGITHACGVLYRGGSIDAGGALASGLSLALPLVGTLLLTALIAVVACLPLVGVAAAWTQLPSSLRAVGVAVGIALPLLVMMRFVLLTQVAVFERCFGAPALRRSAALIDGQLARVLGILFVASLLTGVLAGMAGVALGSVPWLGPAAIALVQALAFAYTTAVGVVLYYDVRCRKGELRE